MSARDPSPTHRFLYSIHAYLPDEAIRTAYSIANTDATDQEKCRAILDAIGHRIPPAVRRRADRRYRSMFDGQA